MKHIFHDNYLPELVRRERFQLRVAVLFLVFAAFHVANTDGVQGQITLNASTSARVTSKPVAISPRDLLYQDLAASSSALTKQNDLLKKLVKLVGPSVAHIEAKKRQKSTVTNGNSANARRPVVVEEAGSGVVIEHNGNYYVITNYHVIESAGISDIRIEVDGRIYSPSRLVHDRQTDISVISLSSKELIPCRIGKSKNVEVGEFVVAVGSPFGLSHSVSYGIISALNRHDLDLGPQGVNYQDFMQTDAAINPGNSGGPLINLRGEIIGINTAIASNSGGNDGIGFSIPMDMVMRIVTDLIELGKVQRGFLGVSLDSNYTYEKASSMGLNVAYGAMVTRVTARSPAADADLRVGDVILEFNGKKVKNDSLLVTNVSLMPINSIVPIKIFRRGEISLIDININNREAFSFNQ
ncbi:trypsin-like peptidase domain-containing protein [Mariniblastus sp.]|nr:trypsin-like peptidase domain-containing protein [bacterium]MDA7903705.1 trypsin-like peptidase domain-containing protein [Mariniblastus sp.]MDA7906127.1 trypsin-like peptidase domain-containing protein [Mariniblastus sp.]MDA7923789.1 trypsin-like peptidase domain-containing protein [Mariniblastus sp.]MDB4460583.1 trypsin-like peptidase domain-containing protein [bacterium]